MGHFGGPKDNNMNFIAKENGIYRTTVNAYHPLEGNEIEISNYAADFLKDCTNEQLGAFYETHKDSELKSTDFELFDTEVGIFIRYIPSIVRPYMLSPDEIALMKKINDHGSWVAGNEYRVAELSAYVETLCDRHNVPFDYDALIMTRQGSDNVKFEKPVKIISTMNEMLRSI